MNSRLVCVAAFLLLAAGCTGSENARFGFENQGREAPGFSADSAYRFIEHQLSFGPRNPGSEGHRRTRGWLIDKLSDYAGSGGVFAQDFQRVVRGDTLQLSNIIASFNTGSSDRIMLCAHWDTRPRAERDSLNPGAPIPGADDGGSGTAVLLELARIFRDRPPPVGVDIVLFDGEDYGREGNLENYFLGSRYWSANPPVEGYQPRFGILLDMVGGEEARFPREGYSRQFAPSLVNGLWDIAAEMGYGELFVPVEGARVSDDHVIVNRVRDIPIIDIIHYRNGEDGEVEFPPYWHTQRDNLEIIDRQTLRAVGEVLSELIYNRIR